MLCLNINLIMTTNFNVFITVSAVVEIYYVHCADRH